MAVKIYLVFWLLVAFLCPAVQANETFKHGVVMARTMVLDANGKPILVEYNEDGSEAGEVSYTEPFSDITVISSAEYAQYQTRLKDYKTRHADDLAKDARLLSAAEFKSESFLSADGKPITKPNLPQNINSVFVRGRSTSILLPSQTSAAYDDLVLMTFPVDLTENITVPKNGDKPVGSIVLNNLGQKIKSSSLSIAPRVGFFGDPTKPQQFYSTARKNDDKIFGGVKNVPVYVFPDLFPGSITSTESKPGREGKYSMTFRLPYCPVGIADMDMITDITAELHYTMFSPNFPNRSYYLRRQDWTYCVDPRPCNSGFLIGLMSCIEGNAILATIALPSYNIDLKVDVMFLSGQAAMAGPDGKSPIPVGDTTEYSALEPAKTPITQNFYDFDGDGQPDKSVLGDMGPITQPDGSVKTGFIPDKSPKSLQAVYFSSASDKTQPNVTRLADTIKKSEPNGLVSAISKEDLKNTDVMVFRESNGELVMDRHGLPQDEIDKAVKTDTGLTKGEQGFYYRLMLRGPMDSAINSGGGYIQRNGSWQDYATSYKLAEPFQKREANHLKPGEWVRIVIINRPTGYIGTQRVQLKDASTNAGSSLNVPIDDIVLRPPNLKIWAEREYKVEKGLTKEQDRRYIIGAEGATLTSDTMFKVYTEWLDFDGTPLPEGLGASRGEQFGYTGRVAKVAGPNNLQAVGSGKLAEFPIAPGLSTQVVSIDDNLTKPEHFYIHVSGTAKNEKPDFSTGTAAPPLDTRPQKLTPFLTPQYDENSDWQFYNAYRDIKREQAKQEQKPAEADKPIKPLPSYVWAYRPEYQFSQYKLELAEINRVTLNSSGSQIKKNIIDVKTPLISSGDQLIEMLYSLFGNENERLSPLDGPQDLVLALGEQETKLTLGKDQKLRIDNIQHLASLSPEDFLTMRLYSNQDAGNILWEYAFEHLILDTQLAGFDANAGRTLYVSADDPVVPLQARLLGYADRSEKAKTPIRINWTAPGASLETVTEVDSDQGVFFNEVKLPPVTGANTEVTIELMGDAATKTQLPKFQVVPGVPDKISLEQNEGEISVGGLGQKRLTFTVRDKNNNLVADGTGVSFFPDASLQTVSSNGATTGGRASITLKGGDYAEAGKLVFIVGEKQFSVDLNVRGLNIVIDAPSNLEAGQSGKVEVTVTDLDNKPAPGVAVSLGTTYGYLKETELTTDANGKASTIITSPNAKGTGVVTAQVHFSQVHSKLISVDYAHPENRDLEVANAAFIGDQTTGGAVNYQRADGVSVSQFYKTSQSIQVQGNQGDTVTVNIGDYHDPNLAPIAAYYLNQINNGTIEEDTGRYPLRGVAVLPQGETRMGAGTSMSFSSTSTSTLGANVLLPNPTRSSKLWGDGLTAIGLPQNTGFTLEVFPKEIEGGTLVNLGKGGQTLTYSNMRYTYKVRTTTGTYSVSSEAFFPLRWCQVSARYQNNKLELWVNQTHYEQPATGDVAYQWSGTAPGNEDPDALHDLEIAGGFNGYLDNLKWYNWASAPVMTFTGGATKTTVTIDATKKATLTLVSTGKLRESGGSLDIHRVAIYTNKVHQYASLISLDAYKVLAGMHSESTPLDQQVVASAFNGLFPPAQADVFDFAMTVISFIFPVQEIGAVMNQLAYLATDPSKFESDVFIVNLIVAATYLPPGRVLQPFARTLGAVFKGLKTVNPKFLKYFGGMFKGVIDRAKRREFDTLWHMIPFFITMAEMYKDPEARKGLEFMFKTVASGEDVLSWVDYLALPANGWDGDGAIPDVALIDHAQSVAPLRWVAPPAYAAIKLPRIPGATVAKYLLEASKKISRDQYEHVPGSLKILVQALKSGDAAALRKYIFNPSMLIGATSLAVRRGTNALKTFLKGKTNARYNPVTVLATVAYLEWEVNCGEMLDKGPANPELECNGKGIRSEKNRTEINNLYRRAFVDSLNAKFDEDPDDDEDVQYIIRPYGHGALFHLNQIAYYQLLHRAGGPAIKEIEGTRSVWLYKEKGDKLTYGGSFLPSDRQKAGVFSYNRKVDIVMGNAGQPEQWIELKSYSAYSDTGEGRKLLAATGGQPIGQWAGGKGKNIGKANQHKQYLLDRIAANEGQVRWLNPERNTYEILKVSADFKWLFQKFKVARPNTRVEVQPLFGSESEKNTIYYAFAQPINADKALVEANLGVGAPQVIRHVQYASLSKFLKSLASVGFKEAASALLEESVEAISD